MLREAIARTPRPVPTGVDVGAPQASDRRDRGRQRQRAPQPDLPVDIDPDELTDRDRCQAANPGALICTHARSKEDVARSYIEHALGWNPASLGDCWGVDSFAPGQIDDCNGAPGERWHCGVDDPEHGSIEISLFGCLCCDENGNSRYQWEPHQSINVSRR